MVSIGEQTPWVRYLDMGLKADPALQPVLIGRGRDAANGKASSQQRFIGEWGQCGPKGAQEAVGI